MTEFGIFLAVVLFGPVAHTDEVAASRTVDGRIAYVSASDCRRGSGELSLSDTRGEGSALSAPFILGAKGPASVAATAMCGYYRTPGLKALPLEQ